MSYAQSISKIQIKQWDWVGKIDPIIPHTNPAPQQRIIYLAPNADSVTAERLYFKV